MGDEFASSNVGLDFAVFNKLSGSVEWFSRKSKDLLFTLRWLRLPA